MATIVPTGHFSSEISVKASRFIAHVYPIQSQDEAKQLIARLRQEHPGVSHVVWALMLGRERSIFAYSDDREPRGTAGRPVFEVLKGSGLTNLVLAVLRYFGGTKLGTGGLVRAYSDAAKGVIALTERKEWRAMAEVRARFAYHSYDRIRRSVEGCKGRVLEEDFGEEVELLLEVPLIDLDAWTAQVRDISSGGVVLQFSDGM